jgi:hypothetical protein
MSENRYWSVEDCCWVTLPAAEVVDAAALPAQREDEAVAEASKEPVEA